MQIKSRFLPLAFSLHFFSTSSPPPLPPPLVSEARVCFYLVECAPNHEIFLIRVHLDAEWLVVFSKVKKSSLLSFLAPSIWFLSTKFSAFKILIIKSNCSEIEWKSITDCLICVSVPQRPMKSESVNETRALEWKSGDFKTIIFNSMGMKKEFAAKKNRRQNIKKWLYDGRKKTREWLKIKFDVEIRHLRILEQWNKNMYTCNEQRIVFGALLNCKLELNLSSTSAFLVRSFATMNCNHFHLSIKFPF